jgi:hypothetical protein
MLGISVVGLDLTPTLVAAGDVENLCCGRIEGPSACEACGVGVSDGEF